MSQKTIILYNTK